MRAESETYLFSITLLVGTGIIQPATKHLIQREENSLQSSIAYATLNAGAGMNPLLSLILLGSVVLALGCAPAPGATNLARTGVASQVSDYPYSPRSGVAKNAIDGNKDTDFNSDSCTHTNLEKDPWWKLDLKQSYKISVVVLTNRMDCCPERLMGAEVRIGNSPNNNNPVCGTVTSVASSTLTFCCPGMEGRYISVVIPGRSEYLSMCEVEAYSDSVTNKDKVCS